MVSTAPTPLLYIVSFAVSKVEPEIFNEPVLYIAPPFIALLLLNRSSNAKKKGLVLMNGVGLIDADYVDNEDNEGEIGFMFMNITEEPVTMNEGDKLGQGMFVPFFITNDDNVENERTGGFGSTGA